MVNILFFSFIVNLCHCQKIFNSYSQNVPVPIATCTSHVWNIMTSNQKQHMYFHLELEYVTSCPCVLCCLFCWGIDGPYFSTKWHSYTISVLPMTWTVGEVCQDGTMLLIIPKFQYQLTASIFPVVGDKKRILQFYIHQLK